MLLYCQLGIQKSHNWLFIFLVCPLSYLGYETGVDQGVIVSTQCEFKRFSAKNNDLAPINWVVYFLDFRQDAMLSVWEAKVYLCYSCIPGNPNFSPSLCQLVENQTKKLFCKQRPALSQLMLYQKNVLSPFYVMIRFNP